jgi:filamentous hemagglutinin family protein
MITRRCQGYFLAMLFGALLNAAGVLLSIGYAQVTTNITSSGLGTTVSQAGTMWNITGGTRPENRSNLFHSFGSLNVGVGNTANFCNAASCGVAQPLGGIQNILGRVTGNQVSNIFGTIRTTGFDTANLFLMNPNGWIFGPTAQLNVGGSFHATTANYIGLADGTRFNSVPSSADNLLTTASPAAFGFLTANPAPINVQAGVLGATGFTVFQVPPGNNTLSFVGGPVNVGPPAGQSRNGFLRAPGGRVNLVSVASAGEAAFDGSGFNVDSFQQLGQINITGGSIVDAKNVFIRGGDLAITSATIFPGFFFSVSPVLTSNGAQAPTPGGGEVNIRVANGVTIGGPLILVVPGIQFQGPVGQNNSIVAADVPNITIQAGSFRLLGQPATIQSRQPQIQTIRMGPGRSPLITIVADTVEVRNGAFVLVGNLFTNSAAEGAGEIVVNARRDVTLSSDGNLSFTGLAAQGTFHPNYGRSGVAAPFSDTLSTADSGSITLNATGTVTVLGRAQVTTDSLAFGRSGAVTVNARDVQLVGAGANTGAIAAQSILAGASGNVTINATGAIDVQNGFRVSTNTGGSGDAGVVSLTGASITVTGADTRIQSAAAQPPDTDSNLNTFASKFNNFFGRSLNYATLRTLLGVKPRPGDLMDVLNQLNARGLTNVADLIPGDGGNVIINNTPILTLDAGARIETSTLWDGNAGAIVGDVGSLLIKGGASIRSTSGGERSPDGVIIGTGSAGGVTFTAADSISISDAGSTVSTTTFGNGNAGSISLSANQVNVQNGGTVTSESGGTLGNQLRVGTGNAGQITVSTPTLAIADAGRISVATSGAGQGGELTVTANSVSISGPRTGLFSTASGSGAGGNIRIQAGQLVQLSNEGTVSAQSTGSATATAGDINISTPTFQSQNASVITGATLADGGNISIATTGSIVQLTDSQITTSVLGGVGDGGNIAIDSQLIVLDNSQILARAVQGHGGNINITGDVFLVNSGGRAPVSLAGIVDASSELSTPGTINIEATFTNVTGSVTLLPSTPLEATELLRASCAARFAGGKASSLVLGGRDGLPLQPGGLLPSPLYVAGPSSGDNRLTAEEIPLRFTLLDSKDRLLNKYSLLPNAKCSL